jgi:hypothetical protein
VRGFVEVDAVGEVVGVDILVGVGDANIVDICKRS